MCLRSIASKFIKSFSIVHANSMVARVALPSLDRCIDVNWVELNAIAAASGPLRCKECGSRAQERIQHQVPTSGAIEQGVGYQRNGFYRRVQSQEIAFITLFGEGIYAWI